MKDNILEEYGFNERAFRRLQEEYRTGKRSLKTNIITCGNIRVVKVPRPEDSTALPSPSSADYDAGLGILSRNEYGLIFMNGGAATRFQKPGENLPKGAFEIMEMEGKKRSFIELKLAHVLWAQQEFGTRIPVWILNSFTTAPRTLDILKSKGNFGHGQVMTYNQGIMKRVIPTPDDLETHYGSKIEKLEKKIGLMERGEERDLAVKEKDALQTSLREWIEDVRGKEGDVVKTSSGEESYNPPGHLDTVIWLVLDKGRPILRMIELGIEFFGVSNIDNLGATVDPSLPGLLSLSGARGIHLLCEVSKKPAGQKGGTLVRILDPDGEREWPQLLEEFAFPPGFDQDSIPEFNNATYTVSVRALLDLFGLGRDELERLSQEELGKRMDSVIAKFPVYIAMKELKESRGGREVVRPVVQFERLLGDLSTQLRPFAVKTVDRFFPVKSRADIPIVVPELRRILQHRVILGT
ncbi:MAG: UTP--glucose-1-phosphate uridylyltransferase [Candidatus Tritonobacter lacicola]|nr:UTP--glucose-1-phosphate uridylyltransferase [Candidatus Tritonobacter lacicola]